MIQPFSFQTFKWVLSTLQTLPYIHPMSKKTYIKSWIKIVKTIQQNDWGLEIAKN
jgi:hypothetical protein